MNEGVKKMDEEKARILARKAWTDNSYIRKREQKEYRDKKWCELPKLVKNRLMKLYGHLKTTDI